MLLTLSTVLALLLDRILGEPTRFHPLVGFGRLASMLERRLIGDTPTEFWGRARGLLALLLLLVVILVPAIVLSQLLATRLPHLEWLFAIPFLYLAIGGQSLAQHAARVRVALAEGNLVKARQEVTMIVSRDCEELDEEGVARATVESVLENGSDAIFAPIFWFLLFGIPGVVLYRIVNTLDAMWGYRNVRFRHFGWAAARLDDVMNWIPARLTALGYTLAGASQSAWHCWRAQGGQMASPNAGVVMAAGAGALRVELGGGAQYHGEWLEKPQLGLGEVAGAKDIVRAIALVNRTLIFWLVGMMVVELASHYLG